MRELDEQLVDAAEELRHADLPSLAAAVDAARSVLFAEQQADPPVEQLWFSEVPL